VNEYEGAVIAISHDWRFLESISDRLWLVENGTAKTYEGDLEDYRKRVLSGGGAPPAASARKKPAPGADDDKAGKRREGAAHRAQIAPLRKEAERLERAIGAQQAEIAQLDRLMATPGLFEKEPAAGADLAQQRARAVRLLEKLEADWFGAAEAYEAAREA
jgi:ATP-binding cassette subfamily F protein 3